VRATIGPSGQKPGAGIGHRRVPAGLSERERERQLGAGRTRGSNSGDTRAPFFLNVKILNEERSTAIGFPFMSATAISTL